MSTNRGNQVSSITLRNPSSSDQHNPLDYASVPQAPVDHTFGQTDEGCQNNPDTGNEQSKKADMNTQMVEAQSECKSVRSEEAISHPYAAVFGPTKQRLSDHLLEQCTQKWTEKALESHTSIELDLIARIAQEIQAYREKHEEDAKHSLGHLHVNEHGIQDLACRDIAVAYSNNPESALHARGPAHDYRYTERGLLQISVFPTLRIHRIFYSLSLRCQYTHHLVIIYLYLLFLSRSIQKQSSVMVFRWLM